eukprot:Plantae.Rhodophyta-Hildenbrandia_rubra.ctg1469.p1 GENE.Plantae.Rhodophyta-Hildenbrandia_rubra.ctg1469~~Plantae.Rhodophyta-Hildenbrandia_rubra.ctg1469.p1  ORF type:complete len:376 (+),score=81.03 Plantae.Rhodophyta-Hildenbrandia_rubra.ctg1469:169-1296(+)
MLVEQERKNVVRLKKSERRKAKLLEKRKRREMAMAEPGALSIDRMGMGRDGDGRRGRVLGNSLRILRLVLWRREAAMVPLVRSPVNVSATVARGAGAVLEFRRHMGWGMGIGSLRRMWTRWRLRGMGGGKRWDHVEDVWGEKAKVVEGKRQFRMHGWCWHHKAIGRDLARIIDMARVAQCSSKESIRRLCDTFGFFVDNIWLVHNRMEREVLFPWMLKSSSGVKFKRVMGQFVEERERIERDALVLRSQLKQLTTKRKTSFRCSNELRAILTKASQLLQDAQFLYDREESVVVPFVQRQFTTDEQNRLTFRLVSQMKGPEAKLQLANFVEVLKHLDNENEWAHYKREVPLPIRLYVHVWRGRYIDSSPLKLLDGK